MTIVFIFFGEYAGFADTLACAKARAGCPIWVISDGPAPAGVHHMQLSAFPEAIKMRAIIEFQAGKWASYSLARWFVLRDFAKEHPEIFPVFCADWDVMLFRNLESAYAPFKDFDYTVSRLPEGMESAAYGVNRMEPLQSYCNLVQRLFAEGVNGLNDMEAWSRNKREQDWNVGNLYEIHDNSVFDHSMHAGAERFEMDGPSLKVVYVNGQPCFMLHDGRLVLANTAHCWGTYKTRTAEMRQAAGIKL